MIPSLQLNIFWLIAERVLRLALTIVFTIWVARYLGAAQYGILAWIIAIISIGAITCQLGLEQVLIKELTNAKDKAILLGSSSLLKAITASITLILIISWSILTNQPHATLIGIMAISLLWGTLNVSNALFQSQMRSHYLFISLNAQVIFSSGLKALAIINNAPLISFAYIYAFDGLASAIACYILYQRNKENPHSLKANYTTTLRLLSLSWPLIISGIFIALYTRIDILFLKNQVTLTLLGNYCFTVMLIEAFFFIPYAISNAFFPLISKKDSPFTPIQEQQLFDTLLLSGIVTFITINLIGPWAIPFILGNEFNIAALILPIYSLRIIFGFIGWGMDRWLIANDLQIYSLYRTGLGLLIGLLLNWLLIPQFSVYGAAIAAVACAGASSLFIPGIFKRSRPGFILTMKTFNLRRSLPNTLSLFRMR